MILKYEEQFLYYETKYIFKVNEWKCTWKGARNDVYGSSNVNKN